MDDGTLPPVDEAAARVRDMLSPPRWRHVEGVMAAAERLALRHGVDVEKAVLAACLHDAAKEWERAASLKRARQFGIIFTELELRVPELWHAPLGAEWARRRLGVEDADVLAAIRYHTTGRAGMSPLEQIVFLADVIEPGRTFPGVDRLRRLGDVDVSGAVLAALDGTVQRLVARGDLLHPDTVAARNDLLLKRQDA